MELFNNGQHVCLIYRDLVTGDGDAQANQCLIYDGDHAALIDPGGDQTYSRLFLAISNVMNVRQVDYVIASHQDPDVMASLNRWLSSTQATLVIPETCKRFIPHFTRPEKAEGRIKPIPDKGMNLQLGSFHLKALPAHFLHAESSFHFYDPVSRILFSGDMGANMCPKEDLDIPARSFKEIKPYMEHFHERHMAGNKACLYWVRMVRQLDIKMIVPQHGRAFQGKAIKDFLSYIEELQCGMDLLTQDDYLLPEDQDSD